MSAVTDMAPPEIERDLGSERMADGVTRREAKLHANLTALAFSADGRLAAATGDGTLLVHAACGIDDPPLRIEAGFPLTHLAARGDGFVCGGQDGKLLAVAADGTVATLHDAGSRWLEALAVSADGTVAASFGRGIAIIDRDGRTLQTGLHPSTISGLAFSPDGGRVAASHYDGVTVWNVADASHDLRLEWKGSHIAVSWSPDGRYVASSTQERELHVWDLVPLKDFRLGGYSAKVRSLGWIAGARALACSGADVVTVWPLAEGGPGAGQPIEVGYVYASRVTMVSPHPAKPWVASGFSNGAMLLGGISKGEARILRPGDGDEIVALCWSPGGLGLAAGTRGGTLVSVEVDPGLEIR